MGGWGHLIIIIVPNLGRGGGHLRLGNLPNFADFILEASLSFFGVHLEDMEHFQISQRV